MYNKYLAELSKEQLLELIELYAKNWLAHDGVCFQSIEGKFGMAEAMYHDEEAWKRFTVIEAKRIKEFLQLPESPGLEGLEQALHYRFYGNLNEHECIHDGNRLVYRNKRWSFYRKIIMRKSWSRFFLLLTNMKRFA